MVHSQRDHVSVKQFVEIPVVPVNQGTFFYSSFPIAQGLGDGITWDTGQSWQRKEEG